MKSLLVALFLSVALLGTAEARLGETYEEVEKRLGVLEVVTSEYPELIKARIDERGGFSAIVFYFFKDTENKPTTCCFVQYMKTSDDIEKIGFTPKDAGVLLAKNFPNPASAMEIKVAEGVAKDQAVRETWTIIWQGAKGENAVAELRRKGEWAIYSVTCTSSGFNDFLKRKGVEEKMGKEFQKQRAMDAL